MYVGLLLKTQCLSEPQKSYLQAMFIMYPYTIQADLEKFSNQLGLSKAKIIEWDEHKILRGMYQGNHLIDKNFYDLLHSNRSVFIYEHCLTILCRQSETVPLTNFMNIVLLCQCVR